MINQRSEGRCGFGATRRFRSLPCFIFRFVRAPRIEPVSRCVAVVQTDVWSYVLYRLFSDVIERQLLRFFFVLRGIVRDSLDHTSQIDSPRSWFESGLCEYGTDRFLASQFAMGVAREFILLPFFRPDVGVIRLLVVGTGLEPFFIDSNAPTTQPQPGIFVPRSVRTGSINDCSLCRDWSTYCLDCWLRP
jgi:hypothetical protein